MYASQANTKAGSDSRLSTELRATKEYADRLRDSLAQLPEGGPPIHACSKSGAPRTIKVRDLTDQIADRNKAHAKEYMAGMKQMVDLAKDSQKELEESLAKGLEKLGENAKQTIEKIKNPVEKFKDELGTLSEQLARGMIKPDQFTKAINLAGEAGTRCRRCNG
jgi:uncharacterized phage infection (PIP) family protein YhgE